MKSPGYTVAAQHPAVIWHKRSDLRSKLRLANYTALFFCFSSSLKARSWIISKIGLVHPQFMLGSPFPCSCILLGISLKWKRVASIEISQPTTPEGKRLRVMTRKNVTLVNLHTPIFSILADHFWPPIQAPCFFSAPNLCCLQMTAGSA